MFYGSRNHQAFATAARSIAAAEWQNKVGLECSIQNCLIGLGQELVAGIADVDLRCHGWLSTRNGQRVGEAT